MFTCIWGMLMLMQIEDLKHLCQVGSRTPGHPENVTTDGIEVNTGKLVANQKISLRSLLDDDAVNSRV